MKKIFLTFCTSNWKNSIARQQNDLEIIQSKYHFFDEAKIYTEKNIDEEYINRFQQHFSDKGFAYWSWKPYIILKHLKELNNNDLLFYMDGGCSFPMTNIENWLDTFNIFAHGLKNYDIGLTFSTSQTECICKKKILQYFNLYNDQYLRKFFNHCQAGIQLMYKTDKIIDLMTKWYQFFYNNYESHIKSDFYDKTNEDACFYHNGSDQAVLQCLIYINKINILNIGKLIQGYKMITRYRN